MKRIRGLQLALVAVGAALLLAGTAQAQVDAGAAPPPAKSRPPAEKSDGVGGLMIGLPPMPKPTPKEETDRAAHAFAEGLIGEQADLLAGQGTIPFNFDGRLVKERVDIAKRWELVFKAQGKSLREEHDPKVEMLEYDQVVARFGQPPAKFGKLDLKKCWFAVVSFEKRPGLLLILAKQAKEGKEAWRVTAVTD
jgi:hypothetical protein